MKKAYRLKKDFDFQRVFKKGRSVANRQLVLYVYPKPEQVHFRVGLSVGKRIGNAVTRNRIKRLLRQALLELEDQINHEFDFVLIAREDILTKNLEEIKKSILHVMKLAGILANQRKNQGGMNEKQK